MDDVKEDKYTKEVGEPFLADVFDDSSKSEDEAEEKALNPQPETKVKVKRNRGLSADIKKQLVTNPNINANDVFEALKSNTYGGGVVKLSTIQSLMSQIKSKNDRIGLISSEEFNKRLKEGKTYEQVKAEAEASKDVPRV